MFEKNKLVKLKELQRARLLQLKKAIDSNITIVADDSYIDSLMVSLDECDKRERIDNTTLPVLETINDILSKNDNIIGSKEAKDIYLMINKYRYGDSNNCTVKDELLNNIDNITQKMIVNDKYNINNTIFFKSSKFEHKYEVYNSHISVEHINRTIEQYIDAWRLYKQKYYHQNVTIEFNDAFTKIRNFRIYFDAQSIIKLFGLPRFGDYYKVDLFKDLEKIATNMPFDIDDKFLVLIRDYKDELLKHEEESSKKFNWVQMHEKTMAFKNLGNLSYDNISIYKKENYDNYFLETKAANSNIDGFVELELANYKNSREDTLSPINIRFKGQRYSMERPRMYLGLASSYRGVPLQAVYKNINRPNSLEFNFDNYLALNQERLYNSADLIISRSNLFDMIMLSDTDLNYLFVSSNYEDDDRVICDKATEDYIENLYNVIDEPLSVMQLKTILKLAKTVKRDVNKNQKMYDDIKNVMYDESKRIVESPKSVKYKRKI